MTGSNRFGCVLGVCVLLSLLATRLANAGVSVAVYTKDEALNEQNISKPRIYVENTGDQPISNFYYYYYFTVENGKEPVVEYYYTPHPPVTLTDVGNGVYRLRFEYAGGTLLPGAILPNTSGDVVGLHYTDWSAWDKTNDYSNNRLEQFAQNLKTPLYASDGVLMYGAEPGSTVPPPPLPPVPPTLPPVGLLSLSGELGEFTVFSAEETNIRDRVTISGGKIGSNSFVEVGCDAHCGTILAKGNVFLRERANIHGDVTAGASIDRQNNVVVEGTALDQKSVSAVSIPLQEPATIGTEDCIVQNNQTRELAPGAYKDLQAFSNATLRLSPGTYTFKTFKTEPDVHITIAGITGNIRINVSDELRIADRTHIEFSGYLYPLSLQFNTKQTTNVFVGPDCVLSCLIFAPNATINVYSRTRINGILIGKKVVIEPDASVCRPPVLSSFSHSEWAYSPTFSAITMGYAAVVPDVTSTLAFSAIPEKAEYTVTVNGNTPSTPVVLNAGTTPVNIEVSGGSCNTRSLYTVNVRKGTDYKIYVNDNSPCLPSACNGASWTTAYKDLQAAIDDAAVSGKEIWVAEGVYKPSKRTDAADPRSATFLIGPGLEIIGGFSGTEIEPKPAGSPYQTILTGDLTGNDANTWPPQSATDWEKMNDNTYHVVTLKGPSKTAKVKLTGFTIRCGNANGAAMASVGGAILGLQCSPVLDQCIVEKSVTTGGGALYFEAGDGQFGECLIRHNIAKNCSGAGLYLKNSGKFSVQSTVFDENQTLGNFAGGAALLQNAELYAENTVIANNRATRASSIMAENSKVGLNNVTVTQNINTDNSSAAIVGVQNSQIRVTNTIVWGNEGLDIICNNLVVNYSCLSRLLQGIGNISANPEFVSTVVAGTDLLVGTRDDGLQLKAISPCIDIGTSTMGTTSSLDRISRPVGNGIDLGAYEFIAPEENIWGRITSQNVWYEKNNITVATDIIDPKQIPELSVSSLYRVIHFTRYEEDVDKVDKMRGEIRVLGPDGNRLAESQAQPVIFYNVGTSSGTQFQSMRISSPTTNEGLPIVFVSNPAVQGVTEDAIVLYAVQGSKFEIFVPGSQFK